MHVSYIFMHDLAESLAAAATKPDVVNLAFGSVGDGDSVTVDDIMKGFELSSTTFSTESIKDAQAGGTKVLASIGGWTSRKNVKKAIDGWEYMLKTRLVEFVKTYGLDGIDIDLEFDPYACETIDVEAVITFMHGLKTHMPEGTLLTYTVQTGVDPQDAIVKGLAACRARGRAGRTRRVVQGRMGQG